MLSPGHQKESSGLMALIRFVPGELPDSVIRNFIGDGWGDINNATIIVDERRCDMAVLFHNGDKWITRYNGISICIAYVEGDTIVRCGGILMPYWKTIDITCDVREKPGRGWSEGWEACGEKTVTVTLWDGTIYSGPLIEDERDSADMGILHCKSARWVSRFTERNGEDMSSNLYWKPATTTVGCLNTRLRDALRRHAGCCGMPITEQIKLTHEDIGILQGMSLAGIEDTGILRKEIKKHGSVIIYEAE